MAEQKANYRKANSDDDFYVAMKEFCSIFKPFAHRASGTAEDFNLLNGFIIHGGTPRDLITGRQVNDIDMLFRTRAVQMHAAECTYKQCIFRQHFAANKQEYYKIQKLKLEPARTDRHISSKKIINARFIFSKTEHAFKKIGAKVTGPRITPTYSGLNGIAVFVITFKNGVEFEVMDTNYFGFSANQMEIDAEYASNHDPHFKSEPGKDMFFEIDYYQSSCRCDASINTLAIYTSQIEGKRLNEWKDYVVDPTFEGKALSDLKNGIIRIPILWDPEWEKSKTVLAYLEYAIQTNPSLCERMVYRTLKNCTKFKGNTVYIDGSLVGCLCRHYEGLNAAKKKGGIRHERYKDIVRHLFEHKYYNRPGIDEDLILAVFAILGYDRVIKKAYGWKAFKDEVDKYLSLNKSKKEFWKKIISCDVNGKWPMHRRSKRLHIKYRNPAPKKDYIVILPDSYYYNN
eukprot:35515_1